MEEMILKERETREQIANIINNSGLPALVLKPMIKDFYEQISALEQQAYNMALQKKQEKENTEKKGEK